MADETGKEKTGDETKGDVVARIRTEVEAALKTGDARQIALDLARRTADVERDNFELRQKVREAKIPDGAVVLRGDDAKDFEAYRALGKPGDLRKTIAERDEFGKANAGYAREKLIADVAELTYPGKAKVLAKLIPDDAEFEFIDVKDPKTGKTAKVPHLKSKVEGEKPRPLTDVIAADHSDFLPALTGTTTPAPRPNTTPAPRSFGGNAPPVDQQAKTAAALMATGNYGL